MKKSLLIFLVLLAVGCSKKSDDTPPQQGDVSLTGKWNIIEQESDNTGFKSVTSDRSIEFLSNNTVSVNGDLCIMTLAVGANSTGSYITLSGIPAFDGQITPDDCNESEVYYKINGNTLTVSYECTEFCAQRFVKE